MTHAASIAMKTRTVVCGDRKRGEAGRSGWSRDN
jgi:hypothetical protein